MTAELFADELGQSPECPNRTPARLDRDQVADLLRELSQETTHAGVARSCRRTEQRGPFLGRGARGSGGGRAPTGAGVRGHDDAATCSNLQPDTRTLVRIASLGGSHLQHHRLAEVCDLDERKLAVALDEAVRRTSSMRTGRHRIPLPPCPDASSRRPLAAPFRAGAWHQRWANSSTATGRRTSPWLPSPPPTIGHRPTTTSARLTRQFRQRTWPRPSVRNPSERSC